jgi:rare lipoprotein A
VLEGFILKQYQDVMAGVPSRPSSLTLSSWRGFPFNFVRVAGCALLLAGCQVEAQKSSFDSAAVPANSQKNKENQSSKSVAAIAQPASEATKAAAGGYEKTGRPYTVGGKLYVPQEQKAYTATGLASWYGVGFHGRETANGEVFNRDSVTVAHPTLPLPSYVRVTNVLNGRSIIARVNDRGPFKGNRLVDVSEQVAIGLNFKHLGTSRLKVDYIGRAPVNVDDSAMLQATLRVDGTAAQLGGRGVASQLAVSAPAERTASFTQDPFGEVSRSGFDRAETATASVSAAPANALPSEGVPLPPQRPFSMGETTFKPQFEGLKISDKSMASDKVSTTVEPSESATAIEALTSRIPLPPVRPVGLGEEAPARTAAIFDRTATSSKADGNGGGKGDGFTPQAFAR